MIQIQTIDDVKLLKELTNDVKVVELEQRIHELETINEKQSAMIDKIMKNLITADKCKKIVADSLERAPISKKLPKKKISVVKSDTEAFDFTETMKRKFNKILVNENELIHHTVRNQKMKLPVDVIEFLALFEIYKLRKGIFLNKDVEKFCKLFNINKVQFGKIYYNLREGVFFDAINFIDTQIRQTSFVVENKMIYIVQGGKKIDTKIDVDKFNYLVNVYVNSKQPYAAIYKLSKEMKGVKPVHLLAVLRKNEKVSKAIKGD